MQEPTGDALPQATNTNGSGSDRNRLGVILFGVMLALVAILLGVLLIVPRFTTPSVNDVIANAKKAQLKDAAYSVAGDLALNIGNTSGGNTKSSITGNGVFTLAPTASQSTLKVELLGPQSQIDLLTVNNAIYIRGSQVSQIAGSGNKWVEIPGGNTTKNQTSLASLYDNLKNPTLVGGETVNGVDTWHIKGNLTTQGDNSATATATAQATGGSTATATEDIWVTKDKYYPARIKLVANSNISLGGLGGLGAIGAGSSGSTATQLPSNSQVGVNLTVDFSKWDKGETITAPAPGDVFSIGDILGKNK